MNDIKTIATELVALCQKGDYDTAQSKLYHPNAYSIEPQGEPQRIEGIEALQKKGEWWAANFDVHEITIGQPIIADDFFSVKFFMDVTHKESGERTQSAEIAVYEVRDGKIVGEQFFY